MQLIHSYSSPQSSHLTDENTRFEKFARTASSENYLSIVYLTSQAPRKSQTSSSLNGPIYKDTE